MPTRSGPRVAVVGAGVVGACIAWRAAEAGGVVTLLEGVAVGNGATGRSFSWVGGSYMDAAERSAYFALKVEGIAALSRMAQVLHGERWLHRCGLIVWSGQADLASRIASGFGVLRESGVTAQLVTRDAGRRIEPGVRIPASALVLGYCPEDGYVDGVAMARAAVEAARQHGAIVRTRTSVEGVVEISGKVSGVRIAGGEIVPADAVVVAAGIATGSIVADCGGFIPLVNSSERGSDAVGLIVRTEPCDCHIRRVNVGDDVMFRPDGSRQLLLHSYDVDRLVLADDSPTYLRETGEEVVALARPLIRTEGHLEVEYARVGLRPIPSDGVAVCGPIPQMTGLYAVVSHSGISLGALLGELAAAEVVCLRETSMLGGFRPARFRRGCVEPSSDRGQ